MIIFDVQSAVYGVGSGNAPALHVERRTPNDGFLFIPNLHVSLSKTGHARARRLRRI